MSASPKTPSTTSRTRYRARNSLLGSCTTSRFAERDVDRAYDQTFHAGKVAVGLVTALGLVGGGVALFIALIHDPHVLGWVFGILILLLFAATFVSGVWTIRSSMPPRRMVTEDNTGWLATLAVEPDLLAQHYLDRASRRLTVMGAEAQSLALIAHAKHRRKRSAPTVAPAYT